MALALALWMNNKMRRKYLSAYNNTDRVLFSRQLSRGKRNFVDIYKPRSFEGRTNDARINLEAKI